MKYDKDADTAIRQIQENRYDGALKDYSGNLLLVGINYDRNAKGSSAKKTIPEKAVQQIHVPRLFRLNILV